MTRNDKHFRQRIANQIREDTMVGLEYRGKHLDEKVKERFRRPAYSVPVRKNERKDEAKGEEL